MRALPITSRVLVRPRLRIQNRSNFGCPAAVRTRWNAGSVFPWEIATMSAVPVAALHAARSVRHPPCPEPEYRLLVVEETAGGPHNLSSILRRTFPQSTVITCSSVDDVIRELTRSSPLPPCVVTTVADDLGKLSAREAEVLALVAKG